MQPEPALQAVRVGKPPQHDEIVAGQGKNYLGYLLGGVLLDQTGNRRRQLGTILLPVGQAVDGDTQALGIARGNRIVEADALDETTIATIAGIGNDHVVERTLLGAATGKTDNNHGNSFVAGKKTRDYSAKSRKNNPLRSIKGQ